MKRSSIVVLVVVLAFVLVVPVFAARKDKVDVDDVFEYTLIEDCEVYGEGWDFAIQDIETAYGFEQIFYNNDDEVVKMQFNVSGKDNLFRADDRDNVVTSNWHVNGTWNLETDEEKYRGAIWNLQLPGEGTVFHVAGANFFENGEFVRFSGLEHVDLEAICRYFAD